MPAPSQEIYDLYSDQLRMLKHGLAMYEPEPNEGEGPVQIGDVGYIDFGRFMPFSSTFLSLHGVPAIDEKYREITKLAKLDKGVMSSRSVRSERIAVDISASEPTSGAAVGASLQFSCKSDRGASLITRHRSKNEKSRYHNVLKEHFVQHIMGYKQIADVERFPVKNLHDIVLVVGRVMTGDWATIAFDSCTQENSASFDMKAATITASGRIWGKWSEHTNFPKRHGPTTHNPYTDSEEPSEETLDQCIFITPFRVSDLVWYKKIKVKLSNVTSFTQKSGSAKSSTQEHESTSHYGSRKAEASGTSQSSPMNSVPGPIETSEDEFLTAYEVLAFRAFQVSISAGMDFDLICIDEEDVAHFQTTSCSLQELLAHVINLYPSIVSLDSVPVPPKIGRVQRSTIQEPVISEVSSSADHSYGVLSKQYKTKLQQKEQPLNVGDVAATGARRQSLPFPRTLDAANASGSSGIMGHPFPGTMPMNRDATRYPCDWCEHDQKRCELQGGVPCKRCYERGRSCTVQGSTSVQNYNALLVQNGNRPLNVIEKPEKDGYFVLLTCDGCICLQLVSLHFVKIGPPSPINDQILQAINTNQGEVLQELLHQIY